MQAALNKYSKDAEVEFLFTHTWDRGEDAAKDAAAYINTNKYAFNILMALKDKETKKSAAVAGYKVTGILAKFILDKKGICATVLEASMPV